MPDMICLARKFLLSLLFAASCATAAWAVTLEDIEARINGGDDQGAISGLQEIVAGDPENYQAWFLLGVTQAKLRRFKDAEVAFKHVAQLKPQLAEPHNNLAVIYNEQGELTAAIRELEASLKLNPDYTTAYENIGDLYLKLAARSYRSALAKGENAHLRMRYDRLLHLRDEAPAAEPAVAEAQPAVTESPKQSLQDGVMAALEEWRAAWSRRDLDGYFAAYDSEFKPGGRFASVKSWQAYKRRVIGKRSMIDVKIDRVSVTPVSADEAIAVFRQHFRSDAFSSDDLKTVHLRKRPSGWKIVRETSK